MSTGKIHNSYQKVAEYPELVYIEKGLNISKFVIPFSIFFKNNNPQDIYLGSENIPFRERDSEFKMILMQEFSNLLKI